VKHISAACHKQKQIEFSSSRLLKALRRTNREAKRESKAILQINSLQLSSVMSPASAGSLRLTDWSSSFTSTCKFLLIIWILFISVTDVCCELNKNCEYEQKLSWCWKGGKS
jgi:hypothetical protein